VTLSSDIGTAYAAQMKAVLARHLPPGHVVDLSHDLPPHAVREAGFLLHAMAIGFPAGTVHVAVVDPGVGGSRTPIAVVCSDGSVLVGPNNGVLAPLAHALGAPRAYRIDLPRRSGRPRVGATFDGRDLFAPAAAAVAGGLAPASLGPPVPLVELRDPAPRLRANSARGEIVHVDRFGNLISNVPTSWATPAPSTIDVGVGRARKVRLPFATHYEALGEGTAGVVGSSFGLLEIAIDRGRADRRWRARPGTPVRFERSARSPRATERVNTVRPTRR
jgi:S-adenosyl-L-methionine hydrolase (adenosine-forming)